LGLHRRHRHDYGEEETATAAEIAIEDLLRDLGYDSRAARVRARSALETAGLTRPGKRAIAAFKRPAAEQTLAATLARVCGSECASLVGAGTRDRREPVVVSGTTCEVCAGSNNRRAALVCRLALQRARVSRVLVVGGTVQQHRDLSRLLAGHGLTVECVDGTRASLSRKDAIADMNRAQLVVIWGSTPLRHAVSNLYTQDPPSHVRVITVARRGIEALCREMARSYGYTR
jgi:hypothetical protein